MPKNYFIVKNIQDQKGGFPYLYPHKVIRFGYPVIYGAPIIKHIRGISKIVITSDKHETITFSIPSNVIRQVVDDIYRYVHLSDDDGEETIISDADKKIKKWYDRTESSFNINYGTTSATIYIIDCDNRKILIQKRGTRVDGTGKLYVPGGLIDKNEHPKDAAIRELKEESGMSVSKSDLIWLNGTGDGSINYAIFTTDIMKNVTGPTKQVDEVDTTWGTNGHKLVSIDNITNEGTVLGSNKTGSTLGYMEKPLDILKNLFNLVADSQSLCNYEDVLDKKVGERKKGKDKVKFKIITPHFTTTICTDYKKLVKIMKMIQIKYILRKGFRAYGPNGRRLIYANVLRNLYNILAYRQHRPLIID